MSLIMAWAPLLAAGMQRPAHHAHVRFSPL
jgi:hypothetical protein